MCSGIGRFSLTSIRSSSRGGEDTYSAHGFPGVTGSHGARWGEWVSYGEPWSEQSTFVASGMEKIILRDEQNDFDCCPLKRKPFSCRQEIGCCMDCRRIL